MGRLSKSLDPVSRSISSYILRRKFQSQYNFVHIVRFCEQDHTHIHGSKDACCGYNRNITCKVVLNNAGGRAAIIAGSVTIVTLLDTHSKRTVSTDRETLAVHHSQPIIAIIAHDLTITSHLASHTVCDPRTVQPARTLIHDIGTDTRNAAVDVAFSTARPCVGALHTQ
jgi:hypothetical protein